MADYQTRVPRLVLVGAGHAHLFVLEALARGNFPPVEATLVAPYARHLYSGMVSGLVSGRYREEELSFDLPTLAEQAGARFVLGCAALVDATGCQVELETGERLAYEVASFATGSSVSGMSRALREKAVPVKPIDCAGRIAAALDRVADPAAERRVIVVGGGAGGVELALNIGSRLRNLDLTKTGVILVDRHDRLVADRAPACAREAMRSLARNRIQVLLQTEVTAVNGKVVRLGRGAELPYDLLVWATGAGDPEIFRASGLETDASGFLLVEDSLRSVSDPAIFAAGDAATLRCCPATPKSGVYSVRQGPVLTRNLRLALGDHRVADYQRYRPQSRSLVLINTGDGRAILSYGPVALTGRWVMRFKEWIDRGFMRRFQRLAAH